MTTKAKRMRDCEALCRRDRCTAFLRRAVYLKNQASCEQAGHDGMPQQRRATTRGAPRAMRPSRIGGHQKAGGVDGADRETEALLRMSAIQLRYLADNASTSGWICDGMRTPGRPQPQNEPMLILPV
jgi:hypothetical protein